MRPVRRSDPLPECPSTCAISSAAYRGHAAVRRTRPTRPDVHGVEPAARLSAHARLDARRAQRRDRRFLQRASATPRSCRPAHVSSFTTTSIVVIPRQPVVVVPHDPHLRAGAGRGRDDDDDGDRAVSRPAPVRQAGQVFPELETQRDRPALARCAAHGRFFESRALRRSTSRPRRSRPRTGIAAAPVSGRRSPAPRTRGPRGSCRCRRRVDCSSSPGRRRARPDPPEADLPARGGAPSSASPPGSRSDRRAPRGRADRRSAPDTARARVPACRARRAATERGLVAPDSRSAHAQPRPKE